MENDKEQVITGEDLARLINSVDKQHQQKVNWWVDAAWFWRTLPMLIRALLKKK